jgi:hypothetical protein
MHPRLALAQALENIGGDGWQFRNRGAFAVWRSHLSLRRHDPDQVLWVGFRPLSPAACQAPHEIAD